jgi:serine/threonine-protein kinase
MNAPAPMDPARWRAVRGLLDQALDLEGEARAAFIAAIADAALRADVARLAERAEQTDALVDRPAQALAASVLAGGSSPRDWDREQIGRRIGAYVLDDLLGAGGMGTVYRAHRVDGRFEQTVAIKLVLTAHRGLRERFRKEQEILAGLRHPAIAQLIDGGEAEDGTPYLAMEYVDGEPITEYCRGNLPDVGGRVRLLLRVAGALAHAHRNLVIHRDIKPSNILVTTDGHPKLLDFGIAKLVGEERFRQVTAQRLGPMTPAWAAPEQFRGQAVTVATDVYQFGMLLYRLITGRMPFKADPDDAIAWGNAVIEDEPITLGRALAAARRADGQRTAGAVRTLDRDVDRDLDAIVRTALAKHPAQRYPSMDAMVADLEAFLDGRPVQARRGGSLYVAGRFVRRHRLVVGAAAAAVFGLIGLTVYSFEQARTAAREAERARAAMAYVTEVFIAADPASPGGVALSAEALLDSAARKVRPMLESHPELRGPLATLMGSAYYNMGAVARSRDLLEQAVASIRADASVDAVARAATLERAASATYRSGELDTAHAYLAEADPLAVGESAEAYRVRDAIADLRWELARDAGESERSLAIAEAALAALASAPEEMRVARVPRALQRRGVSLKDLGRFDESEAVLRSAVASASAHYGPDHLRTLLARQSLGWSLVGRGEPAAGLAELEPVGEQLRALFGRTSMHYGSNLFNRALAYERLGDDARSIELFREAAAAYADSSASATSQVGWAMFNVAGILARNADHGRARTAYAEVESAWRTSMPEDAPIRITLHSEIARNDLALGELAAATRHADRALGLARTLESESTTLAGVLALNAEIAQARGDRARAAVIWNDAAAMIERVSPASAELADGWRKAARSATDSG